MWREEEEVLVTKNVKIKKNLDLFYHSTYNE